MYGETSPAGLAAMKEVRRPPVLDKLRLAPGPETWIYYGARDGRHDQPERHTRCIDVAALPTGMLVPRPARPAN